MEADVETVAGLLGIDIDGAQLPPGPVLLRLADVQREEVEWLWTGRLPRGRLAVLEGNPGVNKSWLALAIAAGVTRGLPLFGDEGEHKPQGVIVLTAEDGLADTVRPRAEDMGADLDLVHVLTAVRDAEGKEQFPNLATDLDAVEAVVRRGGYGLLIINPLNAYLGSRVDYTRDNDVRRVLGPLAQLAERYNLVVICIRHLTKGGRDKAIYRGQGSIAYTAAARVVLLVGERPDDENRRVLVCTKNNLAPKPPALEFEVVEGEFRWIGESDVTADALLAPQDGDEKSDRDAAQEFLRAELENGDRPQQAIAKAAARLDFSKRTLERAKKALGVKSFNVPIPGQQGAGQWVWTLADDERIAKSLYIAKLAILSDSESEAASGGAEVGDLIRQWCHGCGNRLPPGHETYCTPCLARQVGGG